MAAAHTAVGAGIQSHGATDRTVFRRIGLRRTNGAGSQADGYGNQMKEFSKGQIGQGEAAGQEMELPKDQIQS